ncbi:MAG: hypothetical protein HXX13_05970 [Bacteroidetes bacterium]|nr:hypothetical protein [Bacteroidota bacterium]
MKRIYIILIAALLLQACSMSKEDSSPQQTTGQGGSLARFTIVGNYLYTVDESSLNTYTIDNAAQPAFIKRISLGFGTETIFPYKNALLLGTEEGMYVYDISHPESPQQVTLFQHIRSCDPVVAENDYAYITLNSNNTRCWRGLDELQVVDLHNLSSPYMVSSYNLTSPKGLEIHNDTLFVCDDGIRMLSVANKNSPLELAHYYSISANDLIYTQGRLLAIGPDGFSQYSINQDGLSLLSTIPVEP